MLTDEQKQNCTILADYLESLPEDYRHFNMTRWMGLPPWDKDVARYARHNGGVASCGTVACAVGHGPAAGLLFEPDELEWFGDEVYKVCWHEYSKRFVPRGGDELEFCWCFSSWWALHDNHHWGAAARIRYLLECGEPPSDFESAYCRKEFISTYSHLDKRYVAA